MMSTLRSNRADGVSGSSKDPQANTEKVTLSKEGTVSTEGSMKGTEPSADSIQGTHRASIHPLFDVLNLPYINHAPTRCIIR